MPKLKKKKIKLIRYKAHYLSLIIDGFITKENAKTELDKELFAEFGKLSKNEKQAKLDELTKLIVLKS